MRVRRQKRIASAVTAGAGFLGEIDIRVHAKSSLRVKAVMFETMRQLCDYHYRHVRMRPHGEDMRREVGKISGFVDALASVAVDKGGREWAVFDPRYAAWIGLVPSLLTWEVVAHEAVHAGFAYAKRLRKSPFEESLMLDEEAVAYPAGIIASEIRAWVTRRGWYGVGKH